MNLFIHACTLIARDQLIFKLESENKSYTNTAVGFCMTCSWNFYFSTEYNSVLLLHRDDTHCYTEMHA